MVSSNTALPNSRDGVSNPYPAVIAAIWSGTGPAGLVAVGVAGATVRLRVRQPAPPVRRALTEVAGAWSHRSRFAC